MRILGRLKRCNIFKLVLLLIVIIYIIYWKQEDIVQIYDFRPELACKQPSLELWPADFKSFFSKTHEPIKCKGEDWVYTEGGHAFLTEAARQKKAICHFSYLIRGKDDFEVTEGKEQLLEHGIKLTNDFFKVKCNSPDDSEYKSILASIVPKITENIKQMESESQVRPNILMFGFDSVSRATWMRLLPKSHNFFINNLGGVIMEGYNIVGDGTPHALLPILTGHNESDLPEARRGFKNAATVDQHPWIWHYLHSLNYTTLYGEDGSDYGTFTYRMLGFKKQPTDHYMRPYFLVTEKLFYQWEKYCIGGRSRLQAMLDYLTEFQNSQSQLRFSFVFHSELSHDHMSALRLADDDLLHFLHNINLNNTLLILMSDHGARFMQIRSSGEQGKFEERMPYMGISLPLNWKKTRPTAFKNLNANRHILTTPYDIHHTLLDAINQPRVGFKIGQSLFESLSDQRTCESEGIEAQWCSCLSWKPINTSDEIIRIAAEVIVKTINNATIFLRDKCEELKLDEVLNSVMLAPKEEMLRFVKSSDFHGRIPFFHKNKISFKNLYQLQLKTSSNNAVYEGTVSFANVNNYNKEADPLNLQTISRLNRYGEQPACIAKQYPHLRQFCFCKPNSNT